jgi:hypothetical protein
MLRLRATQVVETHEAGDLAELRARLAELDGRIEADEARLIELDQRYRTVRYERSLHDAAGLLGQAEADGALARSLAAQRDGLSAALVSNRRRRPELQAAIRKVEQVEREQAQQAALPEYRELLRAALAAGQAFEATNMALAEFRRAHFSNAGSELPFWFPRALPNDEQWAEFKRAAVVYLKG